MKDIIYKVSIIVTIFSFLAILTGLGVGYIGKRSVLNKKIRVIDSTGMMKVYEAQERVFINKEIENFKKKESEYCVSNRGFGINNEKISRDSVEAIEQIKKNCEKLYIDLIDLDKEIITRKLNSK